ncbi:hypothetical protein KBI52_06645 [Microvirga sp. HBU67558]|uniref:hypothetical protein n=1 Tax=Microvirga TaxID=186650 RepID=UPI001B37A4B6|nr:MULTISPECIES: hypothetical protein [unclassified Microvirga]MBQ0819895.1 hypothetical protein [Microvirga sp. HBU67558]
MAVFHYVGWGTMRPTTRRSQLQRGKKSLYERLSDIDRVAEEAREIVRREIAEYEKQENYLEQVTPGGRYNSEIANSLASQMGISVSEPVKRGRGRPRKYGPNDPRPPRKSRAKVRVTASLVSDVVRGVSPSLRSTAERKSRRASSRTTSGTVSPVTAAPARIPTPPPKAAPKVAAALLESTLAGGLGVDAIQIDAPETAFEIKPVETRTVQITVVENDPEYEAELAEQAALAKALLDAENEPGEEVPDPRVRRTKFTRRYDFSDAQDASKVDPAILALFPHFGMPTTSPSEDMADEDMKKWFFASVYDHIPSDQFKEREFKSGLRIYGSIQGIYNVWKHSLEDVIQRERDRVAIWDLIDTRVTDAEQFSERAGKGEISDDLARMWVAHLDYLALGNLEDSEHLVWREIVDAMEWPKGFSRIDLALWAEQDPNAVPNVRSWAGQPKHFPERLRNSPFPP